MTEPSSGAPSPLPAEPTEPTAPGSAISPDEALEAELEPGDRGEEADADTFELGEEDDGEAEDDGEDELEGELEPESTGERPIPGMVTAPPPGGARTRRRAEAPVVQRAPTQSELAVRVTDNASRLFVLATVAVFAGILAFGLLAGNGGLLTPIPTPTVAPSLSAAPSASAAPSSSAAPSTSAAPSGSAAPSASAAQSPSAAPSPSTGASASPS